jgi:hypothetical protein
VILHVCVAPTKTTQVNALNALKLGCFTLFLFLNVLISAGACLLPLALPAFAMIYLVLQLYDPDATSAP